MNKNTSSSCFEEFRYEKEIQSHILDFLLRDVKCHAWRQNTVGIYDPVRRFYKTSAKKGVPDLIACYEGKFIAIEVKRPSSSGKAPKLRPDQENFRKSVITQGKGLYVVSDSLERFKQWWYEHFPH